MKTLIVAILLFLISASPGFAKDYFVSPNGKSANSGTKDSPWDLQTGLSKSSEVGPGDTLYLLEGTYGNGGKTKYTVRLKGSSSSPVKVRAYPGHRATVNGSVFSDGKTSQYVWYWGFEIMNTMTGRRVCSSDRPGGLDILGGHNKVINMIIHDTGHPGIAFYRDAGTDNDEVYGALIWSNGVFDVCRSDSPRRGSGIYAQHKDGTAKIHDVISFRNFSTGMKAYTEKDYANGFDFEGNINFSNGDFNLFAAARDNPMTTIRLVNNYLWRDTDDSSQRNINFGYYKVANKTVIFQNNYVVAGSHANSGALYVVAYNDARISGNTIVGTVLGGFAPPSSKASSFVWDNNKYHLANSNSTPFLYNTSSNADQGGSKLSLSGWQGKGLDKNSSLTSSLPSQNVVVTRPNKYEAGRGHIAIYNWEGKSAESVNLSGILANGTKYKIVDAQNYYGPAVASGTYNGGTVSLPLTLTAISKYYGDETNVKNVHTSKQFNAFVVIPTGDAEPPAPQPTTQPTAQPTAQPTTAPGSTPRPTATPTAATPAAATPPAATQQPNSGSKVLYAQDDVSVKASTPNTNDGKATTLIIDMEPDPVEFAYLRFALTSVTQKPTKATLRLYVTNGSPKAHQVNAVADTWSESSITFDNRPALGAAIGTVPAVGSGKWVDVDVTSYIAANIGKNVSVALKALSGDGLHFHSTENTNKPQLVLEFGPARKAGDADGDTIIDGADYVSWVKNYSTTNRIADFDGNGRVDLSDFYIWLKEYVL